LNVFGALAFVPANRDGRAQFGIPEAHPLYLWFIAIIIFVFGLGYFWTAWTERREWLFIAMGAIGKLSFFGLLAVFAFLGELPFLTALSSVGDLIFGVLFIVWLVKNYGKQTF
jgi:hypothetical protein